MQTLSRNSRIAEARTPDPRSQDPRAFAARIRMMLRELTPLEAKVAHLMLSAPGFDERTQLRDMSVLADVSEAMVVKVCKKLGFSGFRAFRVGLAEYNRLPSTGMHQDVAETDTSAEILAKVFRSSILALEETLALLDLDAFERAVDLLTKAPTRDFYGVGGSAQIARDAAHKFLRIGIRAGVFDDAHMMLMSASLLRPGDAVVAFSHSGRSATVLEAVELARRQGAGVIAVTNYAASPLVDLSDAVLVSSALGSPLLGENAAARVAQLNILDALFVAVARRDYARAERSLSATMSSVKDKRR